MICFGTFWRIRNQIDIDLQSPIDMRKFILVQYIRVWACQESPANLLYVFQFSHKLQNLRMFFDLLHVPNYMLCKSSLSVGGPVEFMKF